MPTRRVDEPTTEKEEFEGMVEEVETVPPQPPQRSPLGKRDANKAGDVSPPLDERAEIVREESPRQYYELHPTQEEPSGAKVHS